MRYFVSDINDYKAVLKVIVENSDFFSVCYGKRNTDSVAEFCENLKTYCVPELKLGKFDLPKYHRGQKIKIYELNDYTKEIIMKTKSFSDWNLINLPEDICFFHHRKAWLNFISHEDLLFVDFPNDEIKAWFDKLNVHYRPDY